MKLDRFELVGGTSGGDFREALAPWGWIHYYVVPAAVVGTIQIVPMRCY